MADPQSWDELRAWRKEQRAALLRARVDAGALRRKEWNAIIDIELRRMIPTLKPQIVGFYWPFKGEFDGRPLVRSLIAEGVRAALPVVLKPKSPLEFRRWNPGMEMERGVYDIPIPKAREVLEPDLLLIPLVGFDAEGFRLGYGGGYYDRTIAALSARPYAIGIGFELSRLKTIYPQPFDLPMNVVVTEATVTVHRAKA